MQDSISLVIVAIFKNEGHILVEWVHHYLKEGVTHFCLIDNGSTDGGSDLLKEFVNQGLITLVFDDKPQAQTELYNKYFLEKIKDFDWLLCVDLDEFAYSRMGHRTLTNYLRTVPDWVVTIFLPWKCFGSSGHVEQPQSVIQGFLGRKEMSSSSSVNVKTFVRARAARKICIHVCEFIMEFVPILSNGRLARIGNIPSDIDSKLRCVEEPADLPVWAVPMIFKVQVGEEDARDFPVAINHYKIQSLNWFINTKMRRGDAATARVRSLEHFKVHDSNELTDRELAQKVYPCEGAIEPGQKTFPVDEGELVKFRYLRWQQQCIPQEVFFSSLKNNAFRFALEFSSFWGYGITEWYVLESVASSDSSGLRIFLKIVLSLLVLKNFEASVHFFGAVNKWLSLLLSRTTGLIRVETPSLLRDLVMGFSVEEKAIVAESIAALDSNFRLVLLEYFSITEALDCRDVALQFEIACLRHEIRLYLQNESSFASSPILQLCLLTCPRDFRFVGIDEDHRLSPVSHEVVWTMKRTPEGAVIWTDFKRKRCFLENGLPPFSFLDARLWSGAKLLSASQTQCVSFPCNKVIPLLRANSSEIMPIGKLGERDLHVVAMELSEARAFLKH